DVIDENSHVSLLEAMLLEVLGKGNSLVKGKLHGRLSVGASTSGTDMHESRGRHARQSCGRVERPRPLDPLAFARAVHDLPQVTAPLNVEPEVGAIAEYAGEDECGRRGDSSALVAQLVDVFALDAHGLGQSGLRQSHRRHELLD